MPDNYEKVDELLYPQLIDVYGFFVESEKQFVIDSCEDSNAKRGTNLYLELFAYQVLRMALFDLYSGEMALKSLVTKDLSKWFAYNQKTGETYGIKRSLAIQEDQNVYLMDNGFVMKWESYSKRNDEDETYEMLQKRGMQTPRLIHGVKFFGFGVLMIEFLSPLDVTDRPREVARQLLEQLSVIHTIGCYFDLKPDNIRKQQQANTAPKYYIIDMNLSTLMLEPGIFQRKHWTYYYASQTMPPVNMYQRSSYKNDLIELMYVLHQMICKRLYMAKSGFYAPGQQGPIQRKYRGLLGDENNFLADPETMIQNPISGTTIGFRNIKRLLEWPVAEGEGLTDDYCEMVQKLPHGFPPPNVHKLLLNTLLKDAEDRLFQKTDNVNETLQCRVCNQAIAQYRCNACYNEISFLCGNRCATQHKCN